MAQSLYVARKGQDADFANLTVTGTLDVDGAFTPAATAFGGNITVGANDAGYDVTLYGDTAGAYFMWDTSADDVILGGAARIVLLTATGAKIIGAGASGANHALGTTAGNALEFYLDGTHTTGDMRGMYLRLYFSGTGGSGEALRVFSTINNKTVATGGTVNGAHISLSTAGASAAVSGQASALRTTFGIAALSTTLGGTCSVIQVDTDFPTEITVPAHFAFLRFTNLGVKKSNALMRIPNVVAETDGLFCAHTTQVMSHSIRIVSEDGTPYFVMCSDTATNRTVT